MIFAFLLFMCFVGVIWTIYDVTIMILRAVFNKENDGEDD